MNATNQHHFFNGTRSRLGAAISVALLTQAWTGPVLGQATSNEQDGVDEEIYIYGRSLEATLPQELALYGSDLVSLGRDDVEENLYVDPQQMLQMEVPGLYLTSAGPFSYNYISIQGSRLAPYGPSDVLWLVDGVRLNNRLYPSTNPDTLPGNMVERIEVLKGGESLYYGTSAAGGVLNIVSRDFSDTFGGDVSVATDSNDSYNVSAMARGPAGPGNFVFFVSQDESDGYELWSPAEPSATDREQSYDVMNVGFKYGFDISDDMRFVTQLQHTEGEIDQVAPNLTNTAFNERDEEIVSLRFDYAPSEGAQFFIKAYFHDWDSWFTQIDNVVGGAPGEVDVVSNEDFWGYEDKGLNAAAKFRPGNGPEILVGYDYQGYDAVDEVWRIDPITEKVQAVYAQIRTTESQIDNGAISFGVRYNDADAASATVWNLSGKYFFTDDLYIQGGASTNFSLPSAEQLFLNEPCCEVGNPNLKPEESTNFNVGIGAAKGRTYWQATLFWREITDIIGYDYDQPEYENGIFNNLGEATIKGFEVLGGFSLTERLTLEASYIDNEVRQEGQNRQMDYNPEWHAKASLGYDGGRWGGSFGARWVGDMTSGNLTGFGRVNVGDYVVADLSAYFYLGQGENSQIVLRVENALDEEYPVLRGYRSLLHEDGSGRFLSMLQGPPSTVHLSYRHRF